MQDAPIEEIARAVGIARGLIYRVFSSKEELFVLTITDYLEELHDALRARSPAESRCPRSSAAPRRSPASASATRRSSTGRSRSCIARRASCAR